MKYVIRVKEKQIPGKTSILLLLLLSNFAFFLFLLPFFSPFQEKLSPFVSQEKEIQGILQSKTRREKEKLYLELINRIGSEKAQYALYTSGLPYQGESHMLNHTIGDWLFKRYGAEGVVYCKEYFLGSCYHGVLIPLLAEKGLGSIEKVMNICDKRGSDTSIQCAHAVGHGLLSWVGYKKLPSALKQCDDLVKKIPTFPAYNCQDGVFMENIWAVHNNGEPDPDRWFDETDPYFPCNSSKIDKKYHRACWSNQPHALYQQWKGNITRISTICSSLQDTVLQDTCIDSLARQITTDSNGSVRSILALCEKTGEEWTGKCLAYVARSYYSMGDRTIPFQVCDQVIGGKERGECFYLVQEMMSIYSSKDEYPTLCTNIPKAYKQRVCASD